MVVLGCGSPHAPHPRQERRSSSRATTLRKMRHSYPEYSRAYSYPCSPFPPRRARPRRGLQPSTTVNTSGHAPHPRRGAPPRARSCASATATAPAISFEGTGFTECSLQREMKSVRKVPGNVRPLFPSFFARSLLRFRHRDCTSV